MIKSLSLEKWRQYDKMKIDFHPSLTILTGANGAGKTTILNLIFSAFSWHSNIIGTPERDEENGRLTFSIGIKDKTQFVSENPLHRNSSNSQYIQIGEVLLEGNNNLQLRVPFNSNSNNPTYGVQVHPPSVLRGFYITSHRNRYKYENVGQIPVKPLSKQQIAAHQTNSYREMLQGNRDNRSVFYIKEALISLALFGHGNKIVKENKEYIKLFEEFEEILRKILPSSLGFKNIKIYPPEVILDTASGEFTLDSVSGGIASIIDMAWALYMFDDGTPFCVAIDEPENHLHPELQKNLLPNFIKAFPHVQFIIVTHNPFIISSVPDSKVYVLKHNSENKVEALLLDNIEKSGTANEILREVLGIDTTPNWVNEEIEKLLEKYSKQGIDKENIQSFKTELKVLGLEKYIPSSIVNLIQKTDAE